MSSSCLTSLDSFNPIPLSLPHSIETLEDEYLSSKERAFSKKFYKYVGGIAGTKQAQTTITGVPSPELSVNSAMLHSISSEYPHLSIFDTLSFHQSGWINECADNDISTPVFQAGIHSIKKKYCDFHMNFSDRLYNNKIIRKYIPCASWFDSDCADFITSRAISRVKAYTWDIPHFSMVFTLDPAGWDACTWDTIGDFCKLVKDAIDITINNHLQSKHKGKLNHVSVGTIVIPHTFSSIDPTKWQPHFNVLVSTKGKIDNTGDVGDDIDTGYIPFQDILTNYKLLLEKRFGLFRKGNYQVNISDKKRKISDNSFVDILRYNKRAPISDKDILAITDKTITFTNFKRDQSHSAPLTINHHDFITGIMQHLPPKNKVQIHRYGLYHQGHNQYKNYDIEIYKISSSEVYDNSAYLWAGYNGRIVRYNGDFLESDIRSLPGFPSADIDMVVSLTREDSQNNSQLMADRADAKAENLIIKNSNQVYYETGIGSHRDYVEVPFNPYNHNPEVCRILTDFAYSFLSLSTDPPDLPECTNKFGFFGVAV